MRRFLAADLTRNELERLRTQFAELNIQRIWRDMHKRALISQSTHTVQAWPANLGYGATGRDLGWAVLDTGIRGRPSAFRGTGQYRRAMGLPPDPEHHPSRRRLRGVQPARR
jgi:hypothetical protein